MCLFHHCSKIINCSLSVWVLYYDATVVTVGEIHFLSVTHFYIDSQCTVISINIIKQTYYITNRNCKHREHILKQITGSLQLSEVSVGQIEKKFCLSENALTQNNIYASVTSNQQNSLPITRFLCSHTVAFPKLIIYCDPN